MRAVLHRRQEGEQGLREPETGGSCLLLSACGTKSEKLKPVFGNLIPGFTSNGSDECLKIVAFEQRCLPALLAKQQMLVPGRGRDERLTALRLVDALDQTLAFE